MVFSAWSSVQEQDISGSASAFSDIDWGKTALYLRIQLNYQNAWKNMGISRLWTVPYAMVADDLSGSVKKLAVTGETSDMEEALFEVKNKDGQTVFAVYNEGVRIYVDDGAKGAKGGFAVGGFGTSKAPSQNLLYVSADSIRAYIETDPAKGAKGGFAVGGFGTSKGLSQDLFVVSADSIRAYIGTGTGKGAKGGFAVGGFGTSKSSPEEYLRVTRDSTRVYLVDTEGKGNKGGFAIGGFGSDKEEADNFFFINPDSSRFYVRKLTSTTSSTFNIIGFNQFQNRRSLLSANADTVDIQGVLTLQNDLVVGGNINVGGNIKPIAKACIDGDGYTYITVIIGNQVWMAENLRTTRYSNGNLIGTTTLPGDTIYFLTEPRYQWPYSGIEGYAATFGRLYTWWAAADTRNICPTGYHLPGNAEWDELTQYLETNGYGYGGSGTEIAKSMASTIGWNLDSTAVSVVGYNTAANNSSWFNGMPGGYRDTYGLIFTDIGNSVYWWSSTLSEGSYAYSLNYASSYVSLSSYD